MSEPVAAACFGGWYGDVRAVAASPWFAAVADPTRAVGERTRLRLPASHAAALLVVETAGAPPLSADGDALVVASVAAADRLVGAATGRVVDAVAAALEHATRVAALRGAAGGDSWRSPASPWKMALLVAAPDARSRTLLLLAGGEDASASWAVPAAALTGDAL